MIDFNNYLLFYLFFASNEYLEYIKFIIILMKFK